MSTRTLTLTLALLAALTTAASPAVAQTPGVTATLLAFQVFGHPRLTLTHSP